MFLAVGAKSCKIECCCGTEAQEVYLVYLALLASSVDLQSIEPVKNSSLDERITGVSEQFRGAWLPGHIASHQH